MLATEPTSDDCADVVAINQLVHAYAEAVSRGLQHEAAQTYAPNAVVCTPALRPGDRQGGDRVGNSRGHQGLRARFHCLHG